MSVVGSPLGHICTSRAGHDRNEYYVIVSVLDDKHVGVANGVNRTIASPKRKNLSHLSVTKATIEVKDDAKLAMELRKYVDERGLGGK